MTLLFDPDSSGFLADPYAAYAELRKDVVMASPTESGADVR